MKKAVCAGLAAVLLAMGGWFWQSRGNSGAEIEIVQAGKVLYRLDLAKEPARDIVVSYEGRSNTIHIEDGRISITEADCPDQICVRMGHLHSPMYPLVCLPNKLIVRFAES